MNNEELKKKIIEILEETEYEWTEEKKGYILQIFYDKLADALIAAGIGDVGETKEKLKKINERILLGDIIACDLSAKCAEYKHRAEVAERAFSNCLEKFLKFQYEQNCCLLDKFFLEEVNKKCLQQAEKELHEERKDD